YFARCDLLERKYPEAARGFEGVIHSSKNLASPAARRGLAESYRGQGETALETLELRFLQLDLPPEATADREWAEGRLAEIRRDHSGPLHDSTQRIDDLAGRLEKTEAPTTVAGGQAKVEEILVKTAKLIEDQARACPHCSSKACVACKK